MKVGESIPNLLKELQAYIRHNIGGRYTIDQLKFYTIIYCHVFSEHLKIQEVLTPFLAILQIQNVAGPYIRCAIESIHAYILCDALLCEDSIATSLALKNIVESIVRYITFDVFTFTNINSCYPAHIHLFRFSLIQLSLHPH